MQMYLIYLIILIALVIMYINRDKIIMHIDNEEDDIIDTNST